MKEYTDAFLQFLASEKRLSPNTLAAYRNDLRQFEEYLTSRQRDPLGPGSSWSDSGFAVAGGSATIVADPTTASREVVAGFFLSLREDKGYSAATIARKMAAVKSLFHYLVLQGSVQTSPAAEIGAPEVKKPLPRAISVAEIDRLLGHVEKKSTPEGLRDRAMLHLLYATGMRVSELVTIDLSDLDLGKGTVRCVGRGMRVRYLPIEGRVATVLREYLERGRPNLLRPAAPTPALFLNHRGQRLTRQGFWLIMKAIARDSGVSVEVTPHTLRHSFAAHRLSDGLTLPKLRELLGHANISTTQVYTQIKLAAPRSLVAEDRRLVAAGARRG
ncbi:MAG: tyrosine-type recombinase/integrase [Chloroflexi bacterium]|nr:tyrosine-type recombinase/integrase [Chloroflexota bacterium]